MTAKAVDQLSKQIMAGQSNKVLQPLVDELFGATKDHEDIITLFKLLPKQLTAKHIQTVLTAESALSTVEVSQSLLLSKFQGLESLSPDEFIRVVHSAVQTIGDASEVLAPTVFQYRLKILAHKDISGVSKEAHALSTILFAIRSPSYFLFEPLLDTLVSAKFQPTQPDTKTLVTFVSDVLVGGTGVPGLESFLAKAGKDFFTKLHIAESARQKAQLTGLCTVLKGKTTVPFSELQKSIGVTEGAQIEEVVINASMAQILDAAVDRERKLVQVHSVIPLQFDQDAWKVLQKDLEQWMQFTQKCMP